MDIIKDTIEKFETAQIAVTTSPAPLSSVSRELNSGVIVKAFSTNTASVFVGGPSVTVDTGYELAVGESEKFFVPDATSLYVVAAASQKVCVIRQ